MSLAPAEDPPLPTPVPPPDVVPPGDDMVMESELGEVPPPPAEEGEGLITEEEPPTEVEFEWREVLNLLGDLESVL